MAQVNTRSDTASTTSELLAAADASRTYLAIRNEDASILIRVGPSDVEIASGTAANVGLGIPAGGLLEIRSDLQNGSAMAAAEWHVIAESGTPRYSVLEYGDFS